MTVVVHLMGVVRLVRDNKTVVVGGPKQQAVLAALALSAGHRVSTDRLVDLVWDEHPPPSARRVVTRPLVGAAGRRAHAEGGS